MENFKLTNNGIEQICQSASSYLIENGIDSKLAKRNVLTIEEALLKYQDAFGSDQEVTFKAAKILGQLRIMLFISTAPLNPFELGNSDDVLMNSLLSSYNTALPNWKYKNLTNQLVFNVNKPQKRSLLTKIAIAVVVGAVLGFIARLLPGGIGQKIALDYVQPLGAAYTGLLCVMAVFLTLFAVSLGIVHAGDLSTLSSMSKTMFGRMLKVVGSIVLVLALVMTPLLDVTKGIGGGVQLKTAYDALLGFIPSNPISPLVEFNAGQIIVVGALFGFTMLYLGSKVSTLEAAFTECNLIAVNCESFLSNQLIFYYVGMNLFTLVVTASLADFVHSIRIIIIVLTAFALLMIIYTIAAVKTLKCSVKALYKRLMPAFMINLSSATYGSSFTTSIETLFACGTDIDYGSVGHNVGGMLFKPAYAILLLGGTVITAINEGVAFSVGYLLTIALLSVILSIAIPTIPGAAITGFTLMFAQVGLSQESLSVVITLNALLDFFTVAVNGFCLQSEIMIGAKKAGRIDISKI